MARDKNTGPGPPFAQTLALRANGPDLHRARTTCRDGRGCPARPSTAAREAVRKPGSPVPPENHAPSPAQNPARRPVTPRPRPPHPSHPPPAGFSGCDTLTPLSGRAPQPLNFPEAARRRGGDRPRSASVTGRSFRGRLRRPENVRPARYLRTDIEDDWTFERI
jgi:hypothetical protein